MKSRWNVLGPELQIGLLSLALSVSRVASAQPDDTKSASDTSNSASATAPNTTPESSASTEAAAPAKPEPAKAEPAKNPEPPKPEPAKPEPAKTEPAPAAPLSVEILPGSGYPEPRVRGIVGGSLWLTMHGLQFPYMAPETSPNQTRIAVSGMVWDDVSYERMISGTKPNQPDQKQWLNQGLALLRVTPAYTARDGYFAQGNAELIGNVNQYVQSNNMGGVYDVWVRAGKWNLFDVTVGRFQGWEVYHYGMGLDYGTFERRGAQIPQQPHPQTQIYGLSQFWDRPDNGAGNYAAHVYFTDYLRLEVLGQIGVGSAGTNLRGTRPVAILDLGYLKVKAGFEYGKISQTKDGVKGSDTYKGYGGAIQFVANPYIEGGINAAIGYVDDITTPEGLDNPAASTTTTSYGGFLNGRVFGPLLLGLGVNNTHWENLTPNGIPGDPRFGKPDYSNHLQSFFAIQYSFWDKLFLKFVGSYAQFHYEDNIHPAPGTTFTNNAYGGRFRVMYLF